MLSIYDMRRIVGILCSPLRETLLAATLAACRP